jgi:hypothetical protein
LDEVATCCGTSVRTHRAADGDRPVGIASIADILKPRLKEKTAENAMPMANAHRPRGANAIVDD